MRLGPAAPRSRVKHSTTEPLRSLVVRMYQNRFYSLFNPQHCYNVSEEGIICEMKTHTISCAHTQGTTLHINRANYGRTSIDTCKHPYGIERLHNDTNCESNNSSAIVRDLCEGRVSCQLIADGTTFGDPCPGIYKYLDVDFECMESGSTFSFILYTLYKGLHALRGFFCPPPPL